MGTIWLLYYGTLFNIINFLQNSPFSSALHLNSIMIPSTNYKLSILNSFCTCRFCGSLAKISCTWIQSVLQHNKRKDFWQRAEQSSGNVPCENVPCENHFLHISVDKGRFLQVLSCLTLPLLQTSPRFCYCLFPCLQHGRENANTGKAKSTWNIKTGTCSAEVVTPCPTGDAWHAAPTRGMQNSCKQHLPQRVSGRQWQAAVH